MHSFLKSWWRVVAVLALVAMVAACTSETTTSTTGAAAPATTTGSDEPTTTAGPATTTTAADLLAAAKQQEWAIAMSGTGGFENGQDTGFTAVRTPVFRAVDTLRKDGWNITSLWVGTDEEAVQAAITGDTTVTYVPFNSVFSARMAGAPLKVFTAGAGIDFLLVGDSAITGPQDMNGKTIAFTGTVSSGALVAHLYVANEEDVEPIYASISGNSARVTALLAGEIDATTVRLGIEQDIFEQAENPDDFRILYNAIEEYPFLIADVLSYNEELCDDVCKVFLQQLTLQQVSNSRAAIADPQLMLDWSADFDTQGADVRIPSVYFEDSGIHPDTVQQMIDLLDENDQLPPFAEIPPAEDVIDESIWQAVSDQVS